MNNHSSWMGDLVNGKSPVAGLPINNILIPGTHDSGTYGMGATARTQTLSIKEQLEYGVRYLDCRIKLNNIENTFYFHHTLQSPNPFAGRHDTPATNTENVLYDIRTFLLDNPQEILILKFQNILDFNTDQDYLDFLQVIINYLEFTDIGPNKVSCKLVTLTQGTAAYIGKETLNSLNAKKKRVFLFLDVNNVPTDPANAKTIWDHMFQYSPKLTKGNYGLWDPFWGDDSSISVKDVNYADMEDFWKWHDTNRRTWLKAKHDADGTDHAGFYVLQSHMQVLHPTNKEPNAMYYNIAEQVADATYYMVQDPSTGDYKSNNYRNIQHYINQVKNKEVYNIIIFDYIENGDVCSAIVDYYNSTIPPAPQPITFGTVIYLKLNGLNRYVGEGSSSNNYLYPYLREASQQLYLTPLDDVNYGRVICDGDEVLICTTEVSIDNHLSVYSTEQLYYYSGHSTNEQWIIRNTSPGAEIKTGDYVRFESKSYPGQYLAPDGAYVTTQEGAPATRWIIDKAY